MLSISKAGLLKAFVKIRASLKKFKPVLAIVKVS